MSLPNLIVIGAMKCGTSSLHRYLSVHPEIFMSRKKELSFFAERWERGIAWYQEQFPEPAPVRGESSPNYTKYPAFADVASRMRSVLPEDTKFVYVVRDPIERIISHYVDAVSWHRDRRTLDETLNDLSNNHYVNCSRYAMQLTQYLDYFPITKFLVLPAEDLRDRRREALSRVFGFVGVDESFWSPEHDLVVNTAADRRRKNVLGVAATRIGRRFDPVALSVDIDTANRRSTSLIHAYAAVTSRPVRKPQLSDATRQELAAFLHDDVEHLRQLSGLSFDDWSL